MANYNIKAVALLLTVLHFSAGIYAQPDSILNSHFTSSEVGARFILGKIIPHDDTLSPLVNSNLKAAEIHYNLKKIEWTTTCHQGLSLVIADLGNHDNLGYAFGIMPDVSVATKTIKKISATMGLGLGAAWVTKKFSFASNIENVAISTNLNIMARLNVDLHYKISEESILFLGLYALHLSNGGFKKPNYGLNMLGASGGFSIAFGSAGRGATSKSHVREKLPTTWPQIRLYVGIGIKETGDAGGPKYFPVTIQVAVTGKPTEYAILGFGVDVTHDLSSKFHIEQSNKTYSSPNDDFQVGASIYAEVPLQRFSVFARQGFYLYNPNPRLPVGYQNIGFSYMVGHRSAIFISLKSHRNKADHIYAGLALSI